MTAHYESNDNPITKRVVDRSSASDSMPVKASLLIMAAVYGQSKNNSMDLNT